MNARLRDGGWFGAILAAAMMLAPVAWGDPPPDTDGDGIPDDVELTLGYDPLVTTRIVYVDGQQADDSGNGLTELTAKKTILAGVNAAKVSAVENVVLVAAGTYAGAGNRGLDFGGYNIKLIAPAGSAATAVDLEGAGRFLYLGNGESKTGSRVTGFAIGNGNADYGGAIRIAGNAGLTVIDCVFSGNQATGCGGAVFIAGGAIDLVRTRFAGNRQMPDEFAWEEDGGGAVYAGAAAIRLEECIFEINDALAGGALNVSGGALDASACVFRYNTAATGGAIYAAYDAAIVLTNVLGVGNTATAYAFLTMGWESVATMTHCTVQDNLSGNNRDVLAAGSLYLYNSILAGQYEGTPTAVAFSCTVQDSSALGSGNLTADPLTTPGGYLLAASPCRDTAGVAYATTVDRDGASRPVGTGPDMGCHEFLDTDGDGIPDSVETAAGLDPEDDDDALLDEDGDGLANLDEYLAGTHPGLADTDGDGLGDDVELALGYDPIRPTIRLYVDPARPDDAGDGLTPAAAKKTLAAALEAIASSGPEHVLVLAAGVYAGSANRDIVLDGIDLQIRGAGPDATVIDLTGSLTRFAWLKNSLRPILLADLAIRGGNADYGAAVRAEHVPLTLRNCRFESNYASQRGAVHLDGAAAVLETCRFQGNDAAYGGGLSLVNQATATVADSVFLANLARDRGGALALHGGSSLDLSRCQLLHNRAVAGGGALFMTGNGALTMTNALFNFNRTSGKWSGFDCETATQNYVMTNVTVLNGSDPHGAAGRLAGTAVIKNCILAGGVEIDVANPPLADCTYAPDDWSLFGAGNLTALPALTAAGRPLAGSSCLDAGTSIGAPATDLDGVARPAGSGVDIGCFEFLDTDADGIPDHLELAAGLDPEDDDDALLDKDGDGLVNLDEYVLGLDLAAADSDGDGLDDDDELALGYDPTLFTRIIHVDAGKPDDLGNGLSWAAAVKTLAAAVSLSRNNGENVILVAAGTYTGAGNKNLSFGGYDIQLIGSAGAPGTVIDLEGSGPFLNLTSGETLRSRLDGFAVRNGYTAGFGIAVHLGGASLDIRNCVFENNRSGRKVEYDYGDGYIEVFWEDAEASAAVYASGRPVRIADTVFLDNASSEPGMWGMGGGNAGALILWNAGGSVVRSCRFAGNSGFGAGAVLIAGGPVEFRTCRFLNNQSLSSGGAVSTAYDWEGAWAYYERYGVEAPPAALLMENCLLLGNRAKANYADLHLAEGAEATLRHLTVAGGTSRDGAVVHVSGNSTITGSIIQGAVTLGGGVTLVAAGNCVSDSWDAYGSGNLVADPLLTGAGRLTAASPCLDAAPATGAPATDLDGVARPAGTGFDIGCFEFLDTDADGIPDHLELAAGLDPEDDDDALLDKDGDGLVNLDEYILGTDLASSDSDGDGLDDDDELALGYDPSRPTRIIHVNATSGDDANSGLTPGTAKQTIAAGIEAAQRAAWDNVVLVAAGTYTGAGNRNLGFGGYDIKLRSVAGPAATFINRYDSSLLLSLSNGETTRSWLDGFTLAGARGNGSILALSKSALSIRNCVMDGVETIPFDNENLGAPGFIRLDNSVLELFRTKIRDCAFSPGNSLILATGSRIDMDGVTLENNDSGHRDLVSLTASTLNLVNCSILGNNTRSGGGVFRTDAGSVLSAVNCTVVFNTNGVTDAFCNFGVLALVNCIVLETVSGGVRTMDYCCTAADYSDLGIGNFVADPKLSRSGFLRADSPCLDAGRLAGAPTIDIIGTPRPVGAGVDVGCEEFADTDADGLSDYYEAVCGGDLDPLADPDGDGLTNLEEYQLGTDGFNPDSDGDGMPDGWEVAQALDPLQDDAREDPDGDLLLNIEEYEAGANPHAADSDGDGRNDYWEVKEAFSNPNAVDFDGGETLLATVTGNAFTNSGGGWDADGAVACARSRAGWVEYGFTAAAAGVYQIEVEVEQVADNASTDVFVIACYVDGAFSATRRIGVNANGIGAGRFFTPRLGAGAHAVTLVWSNVYRNTILQVNAIRLYALSGVDADLDGVPDWVETRLDHMSAVELPETSLTSPVCVEGGNAAFIEQIAISGFYTPPGQTPVSPTIRNHSFNRWFADLPLNPDGATAVSVSIAYQNGAVTVSENITWTPADLAQLEQVTIRRNDSLLLTAILPDNYTDDFTITVEGTDYELEHGDVLPYRFETAGIVPVIVSWTPVGSGELSLTTFVTVRTAAFNGDPICYVNAERTWLNAGLAEDIFVAADRSITVTELGMQGDARVFALKSRTPAEGYVTARLFDGGPILDVARMVVIEATSHVNDGYHRVITDFGDGTVLYDGYLVVDRVVPGMAVYVNLWGANTVFEDGTRQKWFAAENFNVAGELHFNIIGGTGFSTCQSIELYQDGVLVWKLQ